MGDKPCLHQCHRWKMGCKRLRKGLGALSPIALNNTKVCLFKCVYSVPKYKVRMHFFLDKVKNNPYLTGGKQPYSF